MKRKIVSAFAALVISAAAAFAQGGPGGGGPGPGPAPSPWVINGAQISYSQGVVKVGPTSLSNTGIGTINVSGGYYVNGSPLATITSVIAPLNLSAGVLSLSRNSEFTVVASALALATAQPSVHTWAQVQTFSVAPVFTDQSGTRTALGLGTAAVANTGASGHALPFLDGTNLFSGVTTVSLNASTLPAAQTGTVVRIANASGIATRLQLDAYGAQAFFTTLCAAGTPAAPTTLTAATQCGGYNMFGYDGTAYGGPAATFRTFANQNWAVGSHGSYAEIATTPNGSTTLTVVCRFENDGGVTCPNTVTGGSKGAGTINAVGLYVAGVAVTGAGITALVGDGTATGPGSATLTLATVNSNVGTFGSATQAGQFTVNGKGLITAASNVTITPAVGSITGFGTGIATALAVNVGTAGSLVVNGGALGTPSSGTLTSATGLPISTGLTGAGTGVLTALATNVGSAGAFVTFNGALGTPSSGVGTNLTGTAAGLTAGNVTTNANLTGVITSVGNATSIGAQTGTGTTFAMSVSPTFTGTPAAPTAAFSTNTTQIATTAFVQAAISGSVAGVSSVNALTGALTIVGGGGVTVGSVSTTVTLSVGVVAPQGRLTLQTATPVMTTSQSAKATIYYDCALGNAVPYFDGTSDQFDTITSCEVSTAMQAASTGVINTAGMFDVWWVHSGANRICVATNGSGGGWASDTAGSNTARGTGYSQLDRTTRGYTTNKNAIASCYNGSTNYGSVSANRATYLGSFYSTAAGQTSWTLAGANTAGMYALWNMYNRVDVKGMFYDTTDNWTYGVTSVWRQANASANAQITVAIGLAEDGFSARYNGAQNNTSLNIYPAISVGYDSTTARCDTGGFFQNTNAGVLAATLMSECSRTDVGVHVYAALEYTGSGTVTFTGDNGGTYIQSGLTFNGRF